MPLAEFDVLYSSDGEYYLKGEEEYVFAIDTQKNGRSLYSARAYLRLTRSLPQG